jgi:hypothetical protein
MANGNLIGQGAATGAALGTLLMPGVGTAVGGAIGAGLGAIPTLVKTDAEKENERRLNELRRMQEMGTLGLTEAEKQAIYGSQQSAIQGQMQQAQAQIRAAGAAGMQGGAGAEQLRQLQAAEQQAGLQAGAARQVEAQDLLRKRELEDEIQQRIAAQSLAKQERVEAAMQIPMAAAGAFAGQQIGAMTTELKSPGAAQEWAKSVGIDTSNLTPAQVKALSDVYSMSSGASEYSYLTGGK